MDEHLNLALLIGCVVLLVALLAVRLASRTGLPALLLYLAVGVLLGEAGAGVVQAEGGEVGAHPRSLPHGARGSTA